MGTMCHVPDVVAQRVSLAGEARAEVEKFERQTGDVYVVATKVLFLPGEMNFKLLRALSIKWHMDTFAKLPVQGIATCCCWVNSPAVSDATTIRSLACALLNTFAGNNGPDARTADAVAGARGSRWRAGFRGSLSR